MCVRPMAPKQVPSQTRQLLPVARRLGEPTALRDSVRGSGRSGPKPFALPFGYTHIFIITIALLHLPSYYLLHKLISMDIIRVRIFSSVQCTNQPNYHIRTIHSDMSGCYCTRYTTTWPILVCIHTSVNTTCHPERRERASERPVLIIGLIFNSISIPQLLLALPTSAILIPFA